MLWHILLNCTRSAMANTASDGLSFRDLPTSRRFLLKLSTAAYLSFIISGTQNPNDGRHTNDEYIKQRHENARKNTTLISIAKYFERWQNWWQLE